MCHLHHEASSSSPAPHRAQGFEAGTRVLRLTVLDAVDGLRRKPLSNDAHPCDRDGKFLKQLGIATAQVQCIPRVASASPCHPHTTITTSPYCCSVSRRPLRACWARVLSCSCRSMPRLVSSPDARRLGAHGRPDSSTRVRHGFSRYATGWSCGSS